MARWYAIWLLAVVSSGLLLKIETRSGVKSRVTNIHFSSEEVIDGSITFTYGSCQSHSYHEEAVHYTIAKISTTGPQRLVWISPEDAMGGGCISGWTESGALVGRSEPQVIHHKWKRRTQKRAASRSSCQLVLEFPSYKLSTNSYPSSNFHE